jgi:hypothetical protein
MNRKIILGAVLSTAAIGTMAFVPLVANAQGAQNQMRNGSGYGVGAGNGLEIKAKAMDMTGDQLKEKLQTKTMSEVISGQGMTTEQYHAKVQSAAQDRWQEMGLSQEEIQQRTQDQKQRQANCDGTGNNLGQGGYRNGQNR